MFLSLAHWLLSLFSSLNYGAIIILMAIESSFFPLPSELVMPPAGYLASTGQLNVFLVIAAGALGSVLGALVNYALSATLGRAIIYAFADSRWGKLLLLSAKKLDKSEAYFNRYGRIATFTGRLVPVVRHLISIPAGLSKMPLLDFIAFTALGAAVWVAVLTTAGYIFGANQTAIINFYIYYKEISWLLLLAAFIIITAHFIIKKQRRKKL
jgi:membrane protein DedA with SNARE-associated domain